MLGPDSTSTTAFLYSNGARIKSSWANLSVVHGAWNPSVRVSLYVQVQSGDLLNRGKKLRGFVDFLFGLPAVSAHVGCVGPTHVSP